MKVSFCYTTLRIYLCHDCLSGAPLIGSNPHFFNGDDKYINGVIGLEPNASLHQTTVILEEVVIF